jgi:hypothetical protein
MAKVLFRQEVNTMRINFKSFVLTPAVLAVAALATTTAVAESHVIDVPFKFVAAGHTCPAGNYSVSEDNNGGTVRLSNRQNGFVWILEPGDATVRDHHVVLTFDVAGQNYLLRSVQFGSMITPRIDNKYKESIPSAQQIALGQ